MCVCSFSKGPKRPKQQGFLKRQCCSSPPHVGAGYYGVGLPSSIFEGNYAIEHVQNNRQHSRVFFWGGGEGVHVPRGSDHIHKTNFYIPAAYINEQRESLLLSEGTELRTCVVSIASR